MAEQVSRVGLHLSGGGGRALLAAPDGTVVGVAEADGHAEPAEAARDLLRQLLGDGGRRGLGGLEIVVGVDRVDALLPPRTSRRVGLICTEGFRDSIEIGHGPLGDAWAIRRPAPPPLVARYLRRPVRERVSSHGEVVAPLDMQSVGVAITALRDARVDAIAICLMNAYANPIHERQVRDAIGDQWPTIDVHTSFELLPIPGEYERATTTALAAYVTPAYERLLRVLEDLADRSDDPVSVAFLQPNGGLTRSRDRLTGASVMLSGAASRLAGAAALAGRHPALVASVDDEATSILALDSALPRMDGVLIAAGHPSFLPALDVKRSPVGARSRAVVTVEGGLTLEDPDAPDDGEEAAAPSLDDAARLAGGGADGVAPALDAARRRMARLAADIGCGPLEAAALVLEAASVRLASALRMAAIEKALPLSDTSIVVTGPTAHVLGPRVARHLGRDVRVPESWATAAATGLLRAADRVDVQEQIREDLATIDPRALRSRFEVLQANARRALPGVTAAATCRVHARYRGEAASLPIEVERAVDEPVEGLVERFHQRHRVEFAHAEEAERVEATAISVTLASAPPEPSPGHRSDAAAGAPAPGVDQSMPVATSVRAWEMLQRDAFERQVESVTQLMDRVMARTARSSIFREAHDYSCFVTAADGSVLSQSSGLPIHTGSGAFAVRRLMEYWGGDVHGDDVFILNDPYFSGGAHLPDWTVIAPVMVQGRLLAFACNRSHQLDVGGGALGSQNSDAREIYHEGVRLPPMRLIERATLRRDVFDLLAINTRYPERIADDVRAMIGSALRGRDALSELAAQLSPDAFAARAEAILAGAEARARAAIASLPDGTFHAVEEMNNDCWTTTPVPIELTLTIRGSDVLADFAGSAPQIAAFKNSPFANTFSAVCVGIGTLLPEDVPHNSGTFRSVRVTAPEGSVVNATAPAPVGVGTCYPAWDIVHVVWRALGDTAPDRVPAGWGKTSAPVSVGSHGPGRPYVLYHWGAQPGSGALMGLDGRDVSGDLPALGGFMWPSLEVMEQQFPVRFIRQEFRLDAAGPGEFRGGSGLDYIVEHLDRMVYNLRGEGDRTASGFGVVGGSSGAASVSRLLQPGATDWADLPQYDIIEVPAGSRFWLLSSGGGGWGDPRRRDRERVLRDVRDGFISEAVAVEIYGLASARP